MRAFVNTTLRQAALSNNNIPEAVYDRLIESVNDNLHLLHRYIDIRKRALGLDELHMYDLYTPLVPEVKMNVKYEEAQDMLLKSLHVLGDEYVDILKEAYENRWVDVYENKRKTKRSIFIWCIWNKSLYFNELA